MKTTIKALPKSQVSLTIELEEKEWQKYWNQAVRKVSAEVNIPGFRKGHVPEKMLIEKFGHQALAVEAMDLALPQSYADAVLHEKLNPIAKPEVNIISEQPFSFEVIVSVMPEATVGELKKLKVKKEKIAVSKTEIDEMVEMFRGQVSERKEADRKSKKGDIVTIDFTGFDTDGVQLDGTHSKNHPVEIGSQTMIPGFEEELLELKKGDTKTFTITFPKDYHSPKFANKKVRFDIVVHLVEEKVLPEIDEAFVEKITGTKKPVDDFKKEIEESLLQRKTSDQKQEHEVVLLEEVEKVTTVELPQVLLDEEVEHLVDTLKMRGLQQGMPWEMQLEHMKKSEEDLKKELLPQAEKQIKTRMGIQEFLKKDGITASDEQIQENIAARMMRMSDQQRKKQGYLFQKGERGWEESENRVKVNIWIEQKLKELV